MKSLLRVTFVTLWPEFEFDFGGLKLRLRLRLGVWTRALSEEELTISPKPRQFAKLFTVLLLCVQFTVSEQNVSSEYRIFLIKVQNEKSPLN